MADRGGGLAAGVEGRGRPEGTMAKHPSDHLVATGITVEVELAAEVTEQVRVDRQPGVFLDRILDLMTKAVALPESPLAAGEQGCGRHADQTVALEPHKAAQQRNRFLRQRVV